MNSHASFDVTNIEDKLIFMVGEEGVENCAERCDALGPIDDVGGDYEVEGEVFELPFD